MADARTFFNTHKDKVWTLDPIPNDLETNIDKLRWIFKQPVGWIKLDLEFDLDAWKREAEQARTHYVYHREGGGHEGWQSCCIHGLGVDKTGVWNLYADREPEYHWTELADKTPTIKSFWQQFPFEHLKRVRFMKLAPGGWVAPHNDTPPGVDKNSLDLLSHIVPVNIALYHPNGCNMVLKDLGSVPWQEGSMFIINITNDHTVVNDSGQDRIHLIAHGLIGNKIEEFAELVVRSYQRQYEFQNI